MPKQMWRFIRKEFTMSKECYTEGWSMPYAHYHDDYEIYILEEGQRTIFIEDRAYETSSRDAAFFRPNVPHWSKGEGGFCGICIHFSARYLDQYLTPSAKEQLLKCFASPVVCLSEEAFAIIRRYADTFVEGTEDNFVILITLLHLFGQQRNLLAPCPLTPLPDARPKADQILSYVAENYADIHDIAALADCFQVSEGYIYRIFKKRVDRTPKQYINELRIQHACHCLKRSDETIRAIAAECGFDCYEYFVRVFKEQQKCTPSEYRKRANS